MFQRFFLVAAAFCSLATIEPEFCRTSANEPNENASIATKITSRSQKKLIELGWDIPSTDYLRRNWESMETAAPFDGVMYDLVAKSADGRTCASQSLFQKEPWSRADFDGCVADLKSCNFKRYLNNFIRINFYPVDFEWTDDDAWAAVSEKARICAEVARETNDGLCFDFESYGKAMFRYDAKLGLSFDEAKALARRRGAQFCKAIVDEYPNVVILALWLNSINLDAGKARDSDAVLRGAGYGLLPAFIDGLLDAATLETVFVDGCENGYYQNRPEQYDRIALETLLDSGPAAALVSPENRAKYKAQVKMGFGFYLDRYSNPKGNVYYCGPEPGETRFDRLVANLNGAWNASEYVWIYGEQKRWWPNDAEATVAEAPATKTLSWEEAIPGITQALLDLTNPQESLTKEKAVLEADSSVENLVKNAEFADSSKPGTFASWGVWIREETPGATATINGKAAMRGVEDGCYIQSIVPVQTGEKYFIAVEAKSTGTAVPSATARWQDGAGNWTEVVCDAHFYADSNAIPNADGWTEILGRVVVPKGTGRLVLLLGSNGAGPNDVVVFNRAKVYRRPASKSAETDETTTTVE